MLTKIIDVFEYMKVKNIFFKRYLKAITNLSYKQEASATFIIYKELLSQIYEITLYVESAKNKQI